MKVFKKCYRKGCRKCRRFSYLMIGIVIIKLIGNYIEDVKQS